MKKKLALAMLSLLILTSTVLSPSFVPSTAADPPPGPPPYEWLVKIKQSECVKMNLTLTLTYNCSPIEMEVKIVVAPEVILHNPYELELQCTSGAAIGIIKTQVVPNDIRFTVSIDWNCTDPDNPPDVQNHVFNGTTHPQPTIPPFTIPFHWSKDGPLIGGATPRIVSLDIEPYFVQTHPPVQEDKQVGLGGMSHSCGYLTDIWHREDWRIYNFTGPEYKGGSPFATRAPYYTPLVGMQNMTFSDPDPQTGIVYVTLPASKWVTPMDHVYWSPRVGTYFRVITLLPQDGYGWIFTGNGTLPEFNSTNIAWAVDVDCHVSGNYSGVFWKSPSPMAGVYAASRGGLPDIGPDLVPGTADDGWGDGTPDPKGSMVLYQPAMLVVSYWVGVWKALFSASWPQPYTTGNASSIVIEPGSMIDGCGSHETTVQPLIGHPMECLSECTPWKNDMCNIKVKLVASYPILNTWTALGWLDDSYDSIVYMAREDWAAKLTGDSNWDQLVDMRDIGLGCGAYGSYDEGFPPLPQIAHPRFDARCDWNKDGIIDMRDIGAQCGHYGNEILCP